MAQLAGDERLRGVGEEVLVVGVVEGVARRRADSDWWTCIPEPFSPNSGFGMKVACQPYFIAYSLTVIRYVMQSSDIASASL